MYSNHKILIIDDDEDDQTLLQIAIKESGCPKEVFTFTDGAKALAYLHSEPSKLFLIICDINMPRMNGFQFREHLKKDSALITRCIPFVFLSTGSNPETILKAYTYSPNGYFVKPTDFKDLKKMIDRIIGYWDDSFTPNKVIDLVA